MPAPNDRCHNCYWWGAEWWLSGRWVAPCGRASNAFPHALKVDDSQAEQWSDTLNYWGIGIEGRDYGLVMGRNFGCCHHRSDRVSDAQRRRRRWEQQLEMPDEEERDASTD